jgi:peptidylprolyl isomerase
MRILGTIAIGVAVMASLAACGSSSGGPTPTASAPTPVASSAAPAAALPACTVDDVKVTGAAGSKPTITVPDTCSPPKQLLSKDLIVGSGAAVTPGVTLDTQYDLVTWSTKNELDSSWSRNETFPMENVGNAPVIEGWNEGVIGMKQGGRRLLIVPPDKGYGSQARGPLKANETLVFVVDAVKIR